MSFLLRNILFREGKAVLEKFIGYLISWKFAGSVIVVALTILIIVLLGKFKNLRFWYPVAGVIFQNFLISFFT